MQINKKGSNKKSVKNTKLIKNKWWIITIILLISALLIGSYFYIEYSVNNDNRFYNGTNINGINISNLTMEQASNLIEATLMEKRDKIEIKLSYKDKEWVLLGKDFEVNSDIESVIESAHNFGRDGNNVTKLSTIKKIKEEGYNIDISYKNVLAGLDEKINNIIEEINKSPKEPKVTFMPNEKVMFKVDEGMSGLEVDKEKLYEIIDSEFMRSPKINIEIPVNVINPNYSKTQLEQNLILRSKYSTSYKTSIPERKHNIKLSLSKFNGMEINPGAEVSFNETTGARIKENGYKNANVILNGIFTEGTGGGVCQASTTMYNALILSDLDILEVNKHSLPVSYVPLAFDAMVAEGYADLRFKNNLEYPIYIKAWGDNSTAYVEIYGKPFDNGTSIRARAEFIGVIPHNGDRILKDTNGEYSNKVIYRGEYYRLKYPQEGYESKAFIDYLSSGNVVDSKQIRHEIYQPQEGIIIEGVEALGEGMTIPENNVKIIPPQKKQTTTTANTIAGKIDEKNPTKYNP